MSAASMAPWEAIARRVADDAAECRGMFVKLSAKLNEHVDECRKLRAAQAGAKRPALDELEPDEITQHGTKRYKLKNDKGQEVVFTENEVETVRAAALVVREAKRYAWKHAIPWLLAAALGAWHVARTLLAGHG